MKFQLADGAMGTMLLGEFEPPLALLNVVAPDRITAIHQTYQQAGATILLTNTFAANERALAPAGLADRCFELNQAGAQLARQVAGQNVIVAGSIGPAGTTNPENFMSQVQGLTAGGVNWLWLETFSSLAEVLAVVTACRQVAPHLPIVITLSFHANGKTTEGLTPAGTIPHLLAHQPIAIGANCGNGPAGVLAAVAAMSQANPQIPLIAKASAGLPKWENGKWVYGLAPAGMNDYAQAAQSAGATIIGGCCGTTPSHIQTISKTFHKIADHNSASWVFRRCDSS